MFRTLDPSTEARNRRSVAFICGLLAQVLVISAAVFLGVLFPDELSIGDKRYVSVWLPALTPEKPILEPPRDLARVFVPKLNPPKLPESPEFPALHVAKVEAPKFQPTISSAPIPTLPLPATPVAPSIPPPREQVAIHTGLFGGASEKVTTQRPADQVQTGGFGSPQGLPGRAQGESSGNVPKLGSFGLPQGPGVGNGTGGSAGIRGVIASAGFGSGEAGVGDGRGDGGTEGPKVALGGFEKAPPVAQPPTGNLHVPPPADFQPVEILSKPSPVYTEEARRSRIQGEVALSVVFQATGAIRVIGVVKSLGHGLDQAAEEAATQIRFKPAQRNGKPADFPATLRIEFRLADQST